MLNSVSKNAKQMTIVPRYNKKNKAKCEKESRPGLPPPPLPLDVEEIPYMTTPKEEEEPDSSPDTFHFDPRVKVNDIPNIFGWSRKDLFSTFDYWNDICKECKVSGEIREEKKKVEFTKGRDINIDKAIKRVKQLEANFLRPDFYQKRIPLVHYPNQFTSFKLYFCPLLRHPYFSQTEITDKKNSYVLIAATMDPVTQKYTLPKDIQDSNPQRYDNYQRGKIETNREERGVKGKAKATSSDEYDMASHDWEQIPRPKEDTQWSYNVPDTNSSDAFPSLSSANSNRNQNRRSNNSGRYSTESSSPYPRGQNVNEGHLIDVDDEPPVIKRSIRQQNPNRPTNDGNKPTIGKMVRDYNFAKMKDVLREGLEYVRVHKGEVRFYGCLGKTYFTNVGEDVKGRLWDFTDLKDTIVSGCGVHPRFSNIATRDENLIGAFIQVLGANPVKSSKSAFYEIKAKARNAPHGNFSDVTIYVNMGYVSLEKVVLNWDPLINIDWTVLDRKSDFSMILKARRSIRHDVKPFTTFVKKISVSPETRCISFEDVYNEKAKFEDEREFLIVKSIKFKQVSKFQLHRPWVAEVTRVEKLRIFDQPNSKKRIGKTGKNNELYFTIKVYNEEHKDAFKQNGSLGSGEIANWTVDTILGEHPNRTGLVDFVKTMLLLVERCHKAAEQRAQQSEENQEE